MPVCGPRAPFTEKESKHCLGCFPSKNPKHQSRRERYFRETFYYQSESIDKAAESEELRRRDEWLHFQQTRKFTSPPSTIGCLAKSARRFRRVDEKNFENFETFSAHSLTKRREINQHLKSCCSASNVSQDDDEKSFSRFSCEKHSSGWFHWWDLMIVHRWATAFSLLFRRKSGNGGCAIAIVAAQNRKAITLMILVGRAQDILEWCFDNKRRRKRRKHSQSPTIASASCASSFENVLSSSEKEK